MEEGEEEVVSSIPGGAGSPASIRYNNEHATRQNGCEINVCICDPVYTLN